MYNKYRRTPHRYRDSAGYLYIDGYLYMGGIRMPSMPPRIAMTDRSTGEIYVLGHDGVVGSLYIDLMELDPRWQDVKIYGPYEGPYADKFRLYIDNGILQGEYLPGYHNAPVLTRRDFDKVVLRIRAKNVHGECHLYTEEFDL